MVFKFFFTFCALIITVFSRPLEYGHQQAVPGQNYGNVEDKHHYDDSYASETAYDFNYGVNDPNTGDIKSHQEESKNGITRGRYELVDSDGYIRVVEYTADDQNGFQAVVHRKPTDIKVPVPQQQYYDNGHHQPENHQAAHGASVIYVSSTISPLHHASGEDGIVRPGAYATGHEDHQLTGVSGNYYY